MTRTGDRLDVTGIHNTMLVVPPEIVIAIIDALTCNTQSGAYTYAPEVKTALYNIALVNHAWNQWSTRLLYSRVTVAGDRIVQLAVTLSGATPRTQSLSKRIQSLRVLVEDPTQQNDDMSDDEAIIGAISLLGILAPTSTLRRLFMDTNIVDVFMKQIPDLHSAISRLTSLSELSIINQEGRGADFADFFWDIALGKHVYDCLLGLQALTVGDVTINEQATTDFLLPLVNLNELVLIRPWANRSNTPVGSILAGLFAPHRALQHLTLVLVEGWAACALEDLTAEDLGPAMVPHLNKVDIFSEREPKASRSWMEIGDMIGMGHRWTQRGATTGHVTPLVED
ncbi:hypothetical protein FRB94_004014 [Tulasnella sp. JGI-2019a]|nr:hypothetical protein FRB94_004014 [Tulasnella sp. JGI-2019a]